MVCVCREPCILLSDLTRAVFACSVQAITESATVDACSTALVSAQQAVSKQASRSRTLTMVTRPSRAVSTDTGVNVIGSVARTSQLLAESNVVAPTAGRSCEIM